jgi:hypothetical protein
MFKVKDLKIGCSMAVFAGRFVGTPAGNIWLSYSYFPIARFLARRCFGSHGHVFVANWACFVFPARCRVVIRDTNQRVPIVERLGYNSYFFLEIILMFDTY